MGLAVVAATLAGTPRQLLLGTVILGGFAGGATIAFGLLRRPLASGPGADWQRAVVFGAIGAEGLALTLLAMLGSGWGPRAEALLTLAVIGAHLLPMGAAFGPRAALLGGLCLLNALVGLALGRVPFAVFGITDGVLKAGIGLWMLL